MKRYNCNNCNYSTNYKTAYNKHLNTAKHKKNIGLEPNDDIKCRYCSKNFFNSSSLKRHYNRCNKKDIIIHKKVLKEKTIKYKDKTTDLKEELDDLKAKYKRLKRLHKRTRNKNVFNINIENMNNMNNTNFNKFYIDNVAPPNLEDIVEIEMSDEEIQMLLNYTPEHVIKGILKVKFIKPDSPGESMIVCLDSSRKKYTIRTDNKWMKDLNLEKFRHEFFNYINSGYVKILDNADIYEFNYYDMMNNQCNALKLVNDKSDRTILKSVDNLIKFDENYKNNIVKQINEQIDISSDSSDFDFSSDSDSTISL
ncbi:MAG: hypothetical protein CMF62_04025 [Magnetococcales bacterium]|nr:hypothetical protein [Magnetococcales bacterium]|tara:strand:- start:2778 stop:3707 length:930 start_codon:yes stop_codon:yes gene_type:complete